MLFKNQIVLITGASAGIGAATALRFAQEGASLIISYKSNLTGAEATAQKARELGAEAIIQKADLTIDADAKNLAEAAIRRFGKIDVLVNNAGRYIWWDEWNGNAMVWTESLQQNLISAMSMSKHATEIFQAQRSGVIVNISARYSICGQYEAPAYSAAKAGIVNITEAYAKLLAPFGRANAVSPGPVRAGYWLRASEDELKENIASIPMGKLLESEDIAEAVIFLASEKARMITGQNLLVDGGYSKNLGR